MRPRAFPCGFPLSSQPVVIAGCRPFTNKDEARLFPQEGIGTREQQLQACWHGYLDTADCARNRAARRACRGFLADELRLLSPATAPGCHQTALGTVSTDQTVQYLTACPLEAENPPTSTNLSVCSGMAKPPGTHRGLGKARRAQGKRSGRLRYDHGDKLISPSCCVCTAGLLGFARSAEPCSMYLEHRKLTSGDWLGHQSCHATPRSWSLP